MKRIILLTVMALMLSACAPTAFVVGAAAGGAIIYDQRSSKTMLDDKDIVYRAQARLDQDAELKQKTHLSVTAFNHVLLLVGQAPSSDLKSRAE